MALPSEEEPYPQEPEPNRGPHENASSAFSWGIRQWARIASSSSATMLVILIIGFTAGPEVSL